MKIVQISLGFGLAKKTTTHKPHLQNPLKSQQMKIKTCGLHHWLALELLWPNFEAKLTKNGHYTNTHLLLVMVKPKPLLQGR